MGRTTGAAALLALAALSPVRTLANPNAPATLVATGGTDQVLLNWSPATGPAPITCYYVVRATCTTCFFPTPNQQIAYVGYWSTQFTDVAVAPGVAYFYMVYAVDDGFLIGANSPQATATSTTCGSPAWYPRAHMNARRAWNEAAVVNGRIYALPGDHWNVSKGVEEYDPAADSWTMKTLVPGAVDTWGRYAAGAINGVVYAAGGWCSEFAANAAAYHPDTSTWTAIAPMPTSVSYPAGAVANGLFYTLGYYVQAYDPVADSWTTRTDMPTLRSGAAAATLGGMIVVVGGADSPDVWTHRALPTVEAYNPVTNTWSTLAPMPTPRFDLAVAVIGGTLYAVGGRTTKWYGPYGAGGIPVPTVEAYDPATNSWARMCSMPMGRMGPTLAKIAGTLYVMGGGNMIDDATTGYTDSVEALIVSAAPTRYRIDAPPVVGCGVPFWITVTVEVEEGGTKTDYCGTTDFTSTDVTATIQGTPMAAYNYAWKSSIACSSVPNDDGVKLFVNVVMPRPGNQVLWATDTMDGRIAGWAFINVVCPNVKLLGFPRLLVADSRSTMQYRICWSNYGTDSVFSFVITDAVPTNTAFVPEASVAALNAGNTHGVPLTVGYSTVATPTVPAPASFADGNPVSGTRWLRWTVPEVGVQTTGCGCFRVKVD